MDQIELKATKRDILGKKVRFLRRQGVTPVHLFGSGIESMALQCDTANLQQVLIEAGQTRLINLKLDNEKSPRNIIAREVQREPLRGALLHVDFYQVKMAEVVKVEVPVVLVGEAPALKLKENMLVQELHTLSVECLPGKIPDSVQLDISFLTEPEQAGRVKDIALDKGITVLNDTEMMVAVIRSRPTEKIEEPVLAEGAVREAEAAEVTSAHEEESKE
ncbi:50S ribosomal protein L25 [Chloroflexota bacterium]